MVDTEKNEARLDKQQQTTKTKSEMSPTVEIVFHDEIDAVLSKRRPRRRIRRHRREGVAQRPAAKTRINLGPGQLNQMNQTLLVIVGVARLGRRTVPGAVFLRPLGRIPVVGTE